MERNTTPGGLHVEDYEHFLIYFDEDFTTAAERRTRDSDRPADLRTFTTSLAEMIFWFE